MHATGPRSPPGLGRGSTGWRPGGWPCYTLGPDRPDPSGLGVRMRPIVLSLFVLFSVLMSALVLAGCPVFTRGSGEGRPLETGQPQIEQGGPHP